MERKLMALFALSCAAAFAGCLPTEDTCDLATDELKVEFAVIEESGGATGEATFHSNDVTSLALGDCGDAVYVNGEKLRAVSGTAKPIVYAASIEPADDYEIIFTRPDEGDYVSTVSDLRPEVTVTAPEAGAVITRDQGFDVAWEANDTGEINLIVAGGCIEAYPSPDGTMVVDDGADAVPANGLVWSGTEGTEDPTTCTAEVVLTRSVDGLLDTDLTGTIHGWTAGRTTFTTAPAPEAY